MAARGRPRGFDKDAALTRAMEVFWRQGYDRASMADLTAAMGIASPSLYAAFGSKEELFRKALEHYAATEGDAVWGGVAEAPTAYEAVANFLMRTACVFTRKSKPSGCLIVLSALHATGGDKEIRDMLVEMRAQSVADLQRRLQRAIDEQELPRNTDVAGIARYYVTVQQGMSIQARDGATRSELENIACAALAAWPALVSSTDAALAGRTSCAADINTAGTASQL